MYLFFGYCRFLPYPVPLRRTETAGYKTSQNRKNELKGWETGSQTVFRRVFEQFRHPKKQRRPLRFPGIDGKERRRWKRFHKAAGRLNEKSRGMEQKRGKLWWFTLNRYRLYIKLLVSLHSQSKQALRLLRIMQNLHCPVVFQRNENARNVLPCSASRKANTLPPFPDCPKQQIMR